MQRADQGRSRADGGVIEHRRVTGEELIAAPATEPVGGDFVVPVGRVEGVVASPSQQRRGAAPADVDVDLSATAQVGWLHDEFIAGIADDIEIRLAAGRQGRAVVHEQRVRVQRVEQGEGNDLHSGHAAGGKSTVNQDLVICADCKRTRPQFKGGGRGVQR